MRIELVILNKFFAANLVANAPMVNLSLDATRLQHVHHFLALILRLAVDNPAGRFRLFSLTFLPLPGVKQNFPDELHHVAFGLGWKQRFADNHIVVEIGPVGGRLELLDIAQLELFKHVLLGFLVGRCGQCNPRDLKLKICKNSGFPNLPHSQPHNCAAHSASSSRAEKNGPIGSHSAPRPPQNS